MFYVTKNNVLIEYGDFVNKYWDYPDEAKELLGTSVQEYNANRENFTVVEGELVNITQTQEYLEKIALKECENLKKELQKQINELDLKRIRAMAEPSLKNAETGETWLDFYTLQIQNLRAELVELNQ